MPAPLSDLEHDILDYMVRYLRANTYQPSIREIGEEFGIKSTKTVSEHLGALARKGYLERDPSRSRGVRILGVDLNPNAVSVPCYTGLPDPDAARRTAGVESHFTVDRRMGGGKGAYFVRARGSEYAAAGIDEGDLFLVERADASDVSEGDLIVAASPAGPRLARVDRRAGTMALTPADGGEPVVVERPERLVVHGRVTALYRRLDGAHVPASPTAH